MRVVAVGSLLAAAGTVHAAVNCRRLRRPVVGGDALPPVSVLIPARDEAGGIVECLDAVLAQTGAGDLEILVLDDGSSDGTATRAREVAARDPRVRVIEGSPLPPGWLGKAWACAQLAAVADSSRSVLVFLDADVRLSPSAVAAAVGLLASSRLDLISPHPRQLAISPAERLIQPLLQWSWLTTLPLALAERSARPSLAAANGQFLVVRRTGYERAGGHFAVRAEVLEDLALLRAVKASGGQGGMVDGTQLATCRMYADWHELRAGYGKSLWSAFGSPVGAAGVMGLLGLAYLVPPAAALRGSRIGALGYLAGVAGRVVTARATGGQAWPDALAHPLSIVLLGCLTGQSVLGHRRGRLSWKGRPISRNAGAPPGRPR